ncbi:MAB_1171c family putative transporter [Streptomyces sp900105245]|uniref:MAB_1171c family putative transporter n=1 Tax=Streptomyces sp. 900105245 TaxID=3154379 RepID=A0ABV1UEL9_9ACTN
MLLFNLVYGILAAITWSAFFYKLWDLIRDPRNRELRLLCLAIACFATPFVIASPWLYVRIDHTIGISNITTLFVYTSVAVCETSFLALLVSWSSARHRVKMWHRILVAYAVITVASMVTLFCLGDVSDGEHHVDFDVHYAETPYISEFLLIYALLFVTDKIGMIVMCWRYAKVVDRPWLRRGLRTVAVGAIFGEGYGVPKVASLTWDIFGTSPLHFVSVNVAPMSASIAAWLFAAGFTMPAWGVGLDRSRERLALNRAYRRLHPLWAALTQAFPEVVLLPDVHPAKARMRLRDEDPGFVVDRTVIEIRDGQLALRPHYDPQVAQTGRELCAGRGLAPEEVEAVVEAAQIKAALRVRALGGHMAGHAADVPHDPAAGDMSGEREWLIRVAEAFQRSPLVAQAADTANQPTMEANR